MPRVADHDFPYNPGFTTVIRAHQPPPPWRRSVVELRKGTCKPHPVLQLRSPPDREWLSSATRTQLVLSYPPLDTPQPASLESCRMTIEHPIDIKDEFDTRGGAQVVACTITPQEKEGNDDDNDDVPGRQARRPFTAVAKIYDPLYYVSNALHDAVSTSDMDYANEAGAYEHIESHGRTDFTPEYYGSWTFDLPVRNSSGDCFSDGPQRRPVRLVLIELLRGCTVMSLLSPHGREHLANPYMDCSALDIPGLPSSGWTARDLPEEWRLEVLAFLLDGQVRQLHTGLQHHDAEARNIMLIPRSPGTSITQQVPRIVLFDYNVSRIWLDKPIQGTLLPPNPIGRFWNDNFGDLHCFIPADWTENGRPGGEPRYERVRQWLQKRFGGENATKYASYEKEMRFFKELEMMRKQRSETS